MTCEAGDGRGASAPAAIPADSELYAMSVIHALKPGIAAPRGSQ